MPFHHGRHDHLQGDPVERVARMRVVTHHSRRLLTQVIHHAVLEEEIRLPIPRVRLRHPPHRVLLRLGRPHDPGVVIDVPHGRVEQSRSAGAPCPGYTTGLRPAYCALIRSISDRHTATRPSVMSSPIQRWTWLYRSPPETPRSSPRYTPSSCAAPRPPDNPWSARGPATGDREGRPREDLDQPFVVEPLGMVRRLRLERRVQGRLSPVAPPWSI